MLVELSDASGDLGIVRRHGARIAHCA